MNVLSPEHQLLIFRMSPALRRAIKVVPDKLPELPEALLHWYSEVASPLVRHAVITALQYDRSKPLDVHLKDLRTTTITEVLYALVCHCGMVDTYIVGQLRGLWENRMNDPKEFELQTIQEFIAMFQCASSTISDAMKKICTKDEIAKSEQILANIKAAIAARVRQNYSILMNKEQERVSLARTTRTAPLTCFLEPAPASFVIEIMKGDKMMTPVDNNTVTDECCSDTAAEYPDEDWISSHIYSYVTDRLIIDLINTHRSNSNEATMTLSNADITELLKLCRLRHVASQELRDALGTIWKSVSSVEKPLSECQTTTKRRQFYGKAEFERVAENIKEYKAPDHGMRPRKRTRLLFEQQQQDFQLTSTTPHRATAAASSSVAAPQQPPLHPRIRLIQCDGRGREIPMESTNKRKRSRQQLQQQESSSSSSSNAESSSKQDNTKSKQSAETSQRPTIVTTATAAIAATATATATATTTAATAAIITRFSPAFSSPARHSPTRVLRARFTGKDLSSNHKALQQVCKESLDKQSQEAVNAILQGHQPYVPIDVPLDTLNESEALRQLQEEASDDISIPTFLCNATAAAPVAPVAPAAPVAPPAPPAAGNQQQQQQQQQHHHHQYQHQEVAESPQLTSMVSLLDIDSWNYVVSQHCSTTPFYTPPSSSTAVSTTTTRGYGYGYKQSQLIGHNYLHVDLPVPASFRRTSVVSTLQQQQQPLGLSSPSFSFSSSPSLSGLSGSRDPDAGSSQSPMFTALLSSMEARPRMVGTVPGPPP